MKDYRIILILNGLTGKKEIKGNFFPANGAWDINDFEEGIKLIEYGERWYRECIARLKVDKIKVEAEIDEIVNIGRKKDE